MEIILVEYLGFNVVRVDFTEANELYDADFWKFMATDVVDFDVESWQVDIGTEEYLNYVARDRTVVPVGPIGYSGRAGIYVTHRTLQKQPYAAYYKFYLKGDAASAAGLNFVRGLEDDMPAFLGSEFPVCDGSSSTSPVEWCGTDTLSSRWVPPRCMANPTECIEVVMGPPTWDQGWFEQVTRNLELPFVLAYYGTPAYKRRILEYDAAGRDFIFYGFVPDSLFVGLNSTRLSFPDYSVSCATGDIEAPDGTVDCDYAKFELQKVAAARLREVAPEAYAVAETLTISEEDLNWFFLRRNAAGSTFSVAEAACQWAQENRAKIEAMVPSCLWPLSPTSSVTSVFDRTSSRCRVIPVLATTTVQRTCYAEPLPGMVDRSHAHVSLAIRGWQSHDIANAIVSIVLHEILGYTVKLVDALSFQTNQWFVDMDRNLWDIDVENWQVDTGSEGYKAVVLEKQSVLVLGPVGYTGRSGLYVPKHTVERDGYADWYNFYVDSSNFDAPGLDFVRGMDTDLRAALQSLNVPYPQCDIAISPWCGQGRFEGRWAPPGCHEAPEACVEVVFAASTWDSGVFQQLTKNLNLKMVYAFYGSEYVQRVEQLVEQGKDFLFYGFVPTNFIEKLTPVRVSFPEENCGSDSGEPNGTLACDYEDRVLQKLIASQLIEKAPAAAYAMRHLRIDPADIAVAMSLAGDGLSAEQVACEVLTRTPRIMEEMAPECIRAPKEFPVEGDSVWNATEGRCMEIQCEPGKILRPGASVCSYCAPGQVPKMLPVGHSTDCVEVEPGFYADGSMELPEPCPPGFYSPLPGAAICSQCDPENSFQDLPGQSQCKHCPENNQRYVSIGNGTSSEDCLCRQSFWRPRQASKAQGAPPLLEKGENCLPCPSGGVCLGQDELPYPDEGFWGDPQHPWRFIECWSSRDCLGLSDHVQDLAVRFQDASEVCRPGHRGRLCRMPEEGYMAISDTWFYRCPEDDIFAALGNIAVICTVILLWAVIEVSFTSRYDALDLALLYLQILGLISNFRLRWHWLLEPFTVALGIINFDVDFVPPGCVMHWDRKKSFYLQLLLPVGLLGLLTLYRGCRLAWYGQCKLTADERHRWLKQLTNRGLGFVNVTYHTLALKCLVVFFCDTEPDGETQYLHWAQEVRCFSHDHIVMAVVSILYLLTVIIAFPVFIVCILKYGQKNGLLEDEWFVDLFGFLYQRYESQFLYWEVVLLLRRLCTCLAVVCLTPPLFQAYVLGMLLLGFTCAHFFARPFIASSIDRLDAMSLVCSMIFCLAGQIFYPSLTQEKGCEGADTTQWSEASAEDAQQCVESDRIKLIVVIVTYAMIVLTLGNAGWITLHEVSSVRRGEMAAKTLIKLRGRHTARRLSRIQKADNGAKNAAVELTMKIQLGHANRVPLHEVLRGHHLNRWLKELHRTADSHEDLKRKVKAAAWYFKLEASLGYFLFHEHKSCGYLSKGTTAEVLRRLDEGLPLLADFLACAPQETVKSVQHFTIGYASFLDKMKSIDQRSWLSALRPAKGPAYWSLKRTSRSGVLWWLFDSRIADRRRFRCLLESVSGKKLPFDEVAAKELAEFAATVLQGFLRDRHPHWRRAPEYRRYVPLGALPHHLGNVESTDI